MTCYYFSETRITLNSYRKYCSENNIKYPVFIFPGNRSHHSSNHNLYSIKSGAGLASLAENIGRAGLPVLSLPTTSLSNYSNDSQSQAIAQKAVADLWKAVGKGYSLVIPVRNHKNAQYFSQPLAGTGLEPSFWGGVESTPNKSLADFYTAQLNILAQFINNQTDVALATKATHLTIYPSDVTNIPQFAREAYLAGQSMEDNDPWLTRRHTQEPRHQVTNRNQVAKSTLQINDEDKSTYLDKLQNLKKSIEDKNWNLGLFGGVTVKINDGCSKIMPHNVAKIHKICCEATEEKSIADNINKVYQVLLERDNMPNDGFSWLKFIVKKLDLFNIFGRQQSTEDFYVETIDTFQDDFNVK